MLSEQQSHTATLPHAHNAPNNLPQETRDFFRSFFSLSYYNWTGFLSARLTFTELIGFGLSLFVNASNPARVNLVKMGAPGLLGMLLELTRIR